MMQWCVRSIALVSGLWVSAALADGLPIAATEADVVILGEVHDNADHHLRQADWVSGMGLRAVVFEMLDDDQAAVANAGWPDIESLGAALGWDKSGWPEFSIYAPIFENLSGSRIYGAAVPRQVARTAMQNGLAASFSGDAAKFGLDRPLPEAQQQEREAFQQIAHCNALPEDLLPKMVDIQRLRDAELARVALLALAETGGPVAVITGNGHARKDWGMAVYIAAVSPETRVFSLGQSEDGNAPEGTFDLVLDAPSVDRDDPCEAFLKSRGG